MAAPSKNTTNTWLETGIIAAAVLIVAVGTLVYFAHGRSRAHNTNQAVAHTNAVPNPTVTWQPYTNTKLGFSILIPTDWKGFVVSETDSSVTLIHPTASKISLTVTKSDTAIPNATPLSGGLYVQFSALPTTQLDLHYWSEMATMQSTIKIPA